MLFKTQEVPVLFASHILIKDIPMLSEKAKDFFSRQNVSNLLDLSMLPRAKTKSISESKLRKEIRDFHNDVLDRMRKKEINVCFSKHIPRPKRALTQGERKILIALLLFEHFLGNPRQIKAVKHLYLPHAYASTNQRINPRRSNRKAKFLKMRYFSMAS